MPKITMWECAKTGKLFRTEALYKKHCEKLRLNKIQAAKQVAEHKARLVKNSEIYRLKTFDEIAHWLEDNRDHVESLI